MEWPIRGGPLQPVAKVFYVRLPPAFSFSSGAILSSMATFANLHDTCNRTERVVYRGTVGEHCGDIGVENDYVRSFSESARVLATNTAAEVVVVAHLNSGAWGLLHTPSVRRNRPDAR